MKKKIEVVISGISLVDNSWGGFYRGGTYLLIGPRKSGRTLIGLQYAMESAQQNEVCLYFTSMRPKDLMIHAASIDFDLQNYMNQNLVIVVRVAPPTDLYDSGNPDEFLVEYMNDIITVVDQYQPSKIVFDELTPFIGFQNINILRETFLHTCEFIEDLGITSLFLVGDPATPGAKIIVDTLANSSTGILYLHKNEKDENQLHGGKIIITPNVGHTEGQFSSKYYIEPYKGFTTDAPNTVQNRNTREIEKRDSRYKSLSELNIPTENFNFSNLYDINDFNLILNNQIALYKSTGQIFTIVSFRLDPVAEKTGLLTLTQLQNAIRLSTDKKDKICVMNQKVIVLITKEDENSINSLVSKVRGNLPNTDQNYINNVLRYISVFAAKVDENVKNSEDIFTQLMADEPQEKTKLGFN